MGFLSRDVAGGRGRLSPVDLIWHFFIFNFFLSFLFYKKRGNLILAEIYIITREDDRRLNIQSPPSLGGVPL